MFSKYKAQKVEYDNIKFDSKKEFTRYKDILKPKLQTGAIKDMLIHPEFVLFPSFDYLGELHLGVRYSCDFLYRDMLLGDTIIEEVKGFKTPDYRVKKKVFLYSRGTPYVPDAFTHRSHCGYIRHLKFLESDVKHFCKQYRMEPEEFRQAFGVKFTWREIT
jgi:hypothetical protein